MRLIGRLHRRTGWRRAMVLWLIAWLAAGTGWPAAALAQTFGQDGFPRFGGRPDPDRPPREPRELDDLRVPEGLERDPRIPGDGSLTFPTLTVTQPVNGSIVTTRFPKIVIIFNDGRLGLDVQSFRVYINGVDRTSLFEVATTGATLQISEAANEKLKDLSSSERERDRERERTAQDRPGGERLALIQEGPNTIAASIKNRAGLPAVASSSFIVDTVSHLAARGGAKGPIEMSFVAPPATPPSGARERQEPAPPIISRDLTQFGYDNFSSPISTFAPVSDVPVGPDYVLGPGDVLVTHIWGSVESSFTVPIGRNGEAFLPKVGTVSLAGLTFQDGQRLINQQFSRYYSGYQMGVTIGSLRTVRVYVVGEVGRPGAYNVSPLSSVSNVLYSVGGPTKLGSLRSIKVVRGNQTVASVDLYDFLLKGYRRDDIRLQSEDTILVPSIGSVAAVGGQVKRPAIYELRGETPIADLLEMAGGVMAGGSLARVQVERVEAATGRRLLRDVDLTDFYAGKDPQANIPVRDGDLVKVFPIDNRMYNTVTLAGFVRNPGEYELKAGMKISSLIRPDALLPEAYLDRIEVVRLKPDWTREVIAVNGRGVLQLDIGQDIELKPLDKITVGSEARGPIRVMLKGEFKVPGVYTTSQGERLSSVIARAGGYTDRAYVRGALFLRESVRKTQKEKLDVFVKSTEARLLAEASSYEAAGLSRDESAAEKESLNQRREMVRLVAQQVVPGRVVVRLDEPQKMQGGPYDIELEDGDTVEVPKTPASVLVVGSVRVPTAVTWQKGQNVDYYIDQSGGLAKEADQSEIHVIKPDGTAVASFVRVRDVEPGDVVVVPPETETKVRTRSVIKDIAQIVASMAFAAAGFAAVLR